jgi:rhodanese-related sulfurtransferase
MPLTVKDMLDAANAAVPKISGAEAITLAGQPGTLVVDLRDSAELAATGKIPGAVNVSRGLIEFRADASHPMHNPAFAQAKTVIVHCASGGRAALAGKTLQEMGYTDVRNLGRLQDWIEAGGEVEKG